MKILLIIIIALFLFTVGMTALFMYQIQKSQKVKAELLQSFFEETKELTWEQVNIILSSELKGEDYDIFSKQLKEKRKENGITD